MTPALENSGRLRKNNKETNDALTFCQLAVFSTHTKLFSLNIRGLEELKTTVVCHSEAQ
jgi:hypothetical protein